MFRPLKIIIPMLSLKTRNYRCTLSSSRDGRFSQQGAQLLSFIPKEQDGGFGSRLIVGLSLGKRFEEAFLFVCLSLALSF